MAAAGLSEVEPAGLSKSQRAYQWIKGGIARQELAPGYRLVLASIATELDMSVVPVREALRQLEAEGLVTFERNVGARVSMVDDSGYRHSMAALAVLEGAATALAAPHVSATDVRAARDVNALMIRTLEDFDPRVFTRLNEEFHATLYARCPNPRLVELVAGEWARLGHLRDSTFSFVPGRAQESVAEHEQLLALIERQAPAAEIETAARRHRCNTLEAYLETCPDPDHPGEAPASLHLDGTVPTRRTER